MRHRCYKSSRENPKKRLKNFVFNPQEYIFNPQRYEFPTSVTSFADGSGRIDIK
jgi:hypothetical protein